MSEIVRNSFFMQNGNKYFGMKSVDTLLKEWVELVLSKPVIRRDIEFSTHKLEVPMPEKYKYVPAVSWSNHI